MRKRRVSSLPRFLVCPSSGTEAEWEFDPPSGPADSGTAGHEALQALATGQQPDIEAIAAKYDGVDADEVEFLYNNGARAWKEVGKLFPEARAEEPLEGDLIIGTSDMFHNDGTTMAVLDWKSNRVKRDVLDQVRGYALAAVQKYGMPESGYVTVIIVWVRLGDYDIYNLSEADIENFNQRLKRAEKDAGKSYAPGDACEFCPKRVTCQARQDMSRSAVQSLAVVSETGITRDKLAELYPQAKMLKKALDMFDSALKDELKDGPLPLGDGKELYLDEVSKEKIDARKAWGVLEENNFSTDDLAACITMSKTAVLKIASDRAPRGEKGRAKMALADQLRDSGAVSVSSYKTIKTRKGEQQ